MVSEDHTCEVREISDDFFPDPNTFRHPCLGLMEGGYSVFPLGKVRKSPTPFLGNPDGGYSASSPLRESASTILPLHGLLGGGCLASSPLREGTSTISPFQTFWTGATQCPPPCGGCFHNLPPSRPSGWGYSVSLPSPLKEETLHYPPRAVGRWLLLSNCFPCEERKISWTSPSRPL